MNVNERERHRRSEIRQRDVKSRSVEIRHTAVRLMPLNEGNSSLGNYR